MQKLFHRILVPVDFSFRSVKAAEKAVKTAAVYQSSVTLLHVVTKNADAAVNAAPSPMHVPYDHIADRQELEFQLAKLADRTVRKIQPPVAVTTDIVTGIWDDTVINYVRNYSFDCMIIGQQGGFATKRHMRLNADKIADAANIPVVTIPANRKLISLKSITIPVTDFFPVRKLLYGVYLASRNHASIDLLGIEQEQNNEVTDYYLRKATDWLLQHGVTVKVTKVQHTNTAAAITEFVNKNETDLLILNPGLKTTMPGWRSSLMGMITKKYSLPPVMTVNPA